jgi:Rrf2 family protein
MLKKSHQLNDTILVLLNMKLITRDVDYAIRIMIYLAKNAREKHFDSPEIIKNLKIPKPFARKILRILSKNKILESHKGKDGGFCYNSTLYNTSVLDIIKAFHGKTEINKCIFKKKICPNKNKCPLRKEIQNIEKLVMAGFKKTTIKKLVKNL